MDGGKGLKFRTSAVPDCRNVSPGITTLTKSSLRLSLFSLHEFVYSGWESKKCDLEGLGLSLRGDTSAFSHWIARYKLS
jgi:hypothetical protein